jgi:hypothetical protein
MLKLAPRYNGVEIQSKGLEISQLYQCHDFLTVDKLGGAFLGFGETPRFSLISIVELPHFIFNYSKGKNKEQYAARHMPNVTFKIGQEAH